MKTTQSINKIIHKKTSTPVEMFKQIIDQKNINIKKTASENGIYVYHVYKFFREEPKSKQAGTRLFNYFKIANLLGLTSKQANIVLGIPDEIADDEINAILSNVLRNTKINRSTLSKESSFNLINKIKEHNIGNVSYLSVYRLVKYIKKNDMEAFKDHSDNPYQPIIDGLADKKLRLTDIYEQSGVRGDQIARVRSHQKVLLSIYNKLMHLVGYDDQEILKSLGVPSSIGKNMESDMQSLSLIITKKINEKLSNSDGLKRDVLSNIADKSGVSVSTLQQVLENKKKDMNILSLHQLIKTLY
ncbi:hypothetical protein DY052_06385 [Apilactobacillus timberlakei]|uniref:hypothetical protein n=1 Tax=Apilactobacillus timberlakei TaxID=2008380 RepID=UPI00112BF74E|nr:hypothetical protein [Apilactobacillus timberlakei]TPR15052.1 hypothetical protein DY052_06385 [Apilactobacillus timberlakei]